MSKTKKEPTKIEAVKTESGTPEVVKFEKTRAHQTYKTLTGEKVTGVTTALGIINKPALLNWAWECGKDGIDFRKSKDNAADIGTLAHFLIECYLGGRVACLSEFSQSDQDKAKAGFDVFLKFWNQNQFTIVASEVQLACDTCLHPPFGGTLDIVAKRGDGAICLIDIKTSKGIYDEYLYQLAAYEHLWNDGLLRMEDGEPMSRPALPVDRSQHIADHYIVRTGKSQEDTGEIRQIGNLEKHYKVFNAALKLHCLIKEAKK
jgi:hypothetical protein